uniref:Uncharacterized protein n=1 Tax=Eptatretus burgeri TaxID=7764 RepID=A0A8C4WWZ5_EPTBU
MSVLCSDRVPSAWVESGARSRCNTQTKSLSSSSSSPSSSSSECESHVNQPRSQSPSFCHLASRPMRSHTAFTTDASSKSVPVPAASSGLEPRFPWGDPLSWNSAYKSQALVGLTPTALPRRSDSGMQTCVLNPAREDITKMLPDDACSDTSAAKGFKESINSGRTSNLNPFNTKACNIEISSVENSHRDVSQGGNSSSEDLSADRTTVFENRVCNTKTQCFENDDRYLNIDDTSRERDIKDLDWTSSIKEMKFGVNKWSCTENSSTNVYSERLSMKASLDIVDSVNADEDVCNNCSSKLDGIGIMSNNCGRHSNSFNLMTVEIGCSNNPDMTLCIENDDSMDVHRDLFKLIYFNSNLANIFRTANENTRLSLFPFGNKAEARAFRRCCRIKSDGEKVIMEISGDELRRIYDEVLWWKNKKAIKHVDALEDEHCMMNQRENDVLREWFKETFDCGHIECNFWNGGIQMKILEGENGWRENNGETISENKILEMKEVVCNDKKELKNFEKNLNEIDLEQLSAVMEIDDGAKMSNTVVRCPGKFDRGREGVFEEDSIDEDMSWNINSDVYDDAGKLQDLSEDIIMEKVECKHQMTTQRWQMWDVQGDFGNLLRRKSVEEYDLEGSRKKDWNTEVVTLEEELCRREEEVWMAAQLGQELLHQNSELRRELSHLHEDLAQRVETLAQENYSLRGRMAWREAALQGRVADLEIELGQAMVQVGELKDALVKALANEEHTKRRAEDLAERLREEEESAAGIEHRLTIQLQKVTSDLSIRAVSAQQHAKHLEEMHTQIAHLNVCGRKLEERLQEMEEENGSLKEILQEVKEELQHKDDLIRQAQEEEQELKAVLNLWHKGCPQRVDNDKTVGRNEVEEQQYDWIRGMKEITDTRPERPEGTWWGEKMAFMGEASIREEIEASLEVEQLKADVDLAYSLLEDLCCHLRCHDFGHPSPLSIGKSRKMRQWEIEPMVNGDIISGTSGIEERIGEERSEGVKESLKAIRNKAQKLCTRKRKVTRADVDLEDELWKSSGECEKLGLESGEHADIRLCKADWDKEIVMKRSPTENEHHMAQIEGTSVAKSNDWTGDHYQKGMPMERNEERNYRTIDRVCREFEKKPREELKTKASERNGWKKETKTKCVEVGIKNTGGENNLEKKDKELRREKKKQYAECGESFKLNRIKIEAWKCRCYVSAFSAKQISNLEGNWDDGGYAARKEVSRFPHLTVPFQRGLRELVFEAYALVETLLQGTMCKRDSRREDREQEAMEVCNPKKQQNRDLPMKIEQQQSILEENQQMLLKALDEAIAGKETLELELNQSQAQVFELEHQLLDSWRRQHCLFRELESWQFATSGLLVILLLCLFI